MPDSVIICKKGKDSSNPKAIYANTKSNTFFGCKVVKRDSTEGNTKDGQKPKRQVKNPYIRDKQAKKFFNEPLKEKIFVDTDSYIDRYDFSSVDS